MLLAGAIIAMFDHGFSLDIVRSMIVNEIVCVSSESLGLVVDPADVVIHMPEPVVPVAPTKPLVGGFFISGNGPSFAFGTGVVAGVQGGTAAVSSVDTPQPVNVWDGMSFTQSGLKLVAKVNYNAMFQQYSGWWNLVQ